MIRPAAFDYNPQTAGTNRLQSPDLAGPQARALAVAEFDSFVASLRREGVAVCVVDDTPVPHKPDAVFPNNWVSFHEEGTVVLYPMHADNRRWERREDVLHAVRDELGFGIERKIDLTHHEGSGRFLEGTGSLVLDCANRIAYACISARTDPELAREWGSMLDYEVVTFEARDPRGVPYYHTNVMMYVGSTSAVLATCALSAAEATRVKSRLEASGREVIEIDFDEIESFAGNLIELEGGPSARRRRILVMSQTARGGLRADTWARLAAGADTVLVAPIPTIEKLGGGSVRCMLAEVFLPGAVTG